MAMAPGGAAGRVGEDLVAGRVRERPDAVLGEGVGLVFEEQVAVDRAGQARLDEALADELAAAGRFELGAAVEVDVHAERGGDGVEAGARGRRGRRVGEGGLGTGQPLAERVADRLAVLLHDHLPPHDARQRDARQPDDEEPVEDAVAEPRPLGGEQPGPVAHVQPDGEHERAGRQPGEAQPEQDEQHVEPVLGRRPDGHHVAGALALALVVDHHRAPAERVAGAVGAGAVGEGGVDRRVEAERGLAAAADAGAVVVLGVAEVLVVEAEQAGRGEDARERGLAGVARGARRRAEVDPRDGLAVVGEERADGGLVLQDGAGPPALLVGPPHGVEATGVLRAEERGRAALDVAPERVAGRPDEP